MTNQNLITPEILVPRVGDYLVDKGILSRQDLEYALRVQKDLRESGKEVLVGQLLVDLHLVDRADLDRSVTEQILQLRQALQETNQQLERRVEERTAELQSALKKLSELNQLKSNIISNISHELRTPLTHIKGYLELFATDFLGKVTTEQSDALGIMLKSAERLEQLIDDLIRFSLSSQGEFSLRLIPFDVTGLCIKLIKRIQPRAEEKQISLKINANLIPPVKADEEKVTWVILQLLDNAIKFTPAGGEIVLTIEREEDFAQISVSDTGIGISSEKIPEIFEPFHQLDGTSTRRYGGTGLGLALVRQIVEAHGSVVRVHSEVGKGTHFEFLLPLANLAV
jgi:signal transduction histidine kinase